jgi:hypothetical protein
MGKKMGSAKKASKPRKQQQASPLPSDMEDEVEKFHKSREEAQTREFISLHTSELQSDDSLDDEGVLQVDDSEEYDTDEEIERGTHLGKRERHAQAHACAAPHVRARRPPTRPPSL